MGTSDIWYAGRTIKALPAKQEHFNDFYIFHMIVSINTADNAGISTRAKIIFEQRNSLSLLTIRTNPSTSIDVVQ